MKEGGLLSRHFICQRIQPLNFLQFLNNIFLSGSLCACTGIYCVNEPFYGSSKLTNPPPITATFDVVSGLLDSILVYFLKKRKKFLCRTSELGYTLQVSQVSRQLQKSGCDVTPNFIHTVILEYFNIKE